MLPIISHFSNYIQHTLTFPFRPSQISPCLCCTLIFLCVLVTLTKPLNASYGCDSALFYCQPNIFNISLCFVNNNSWKLKIFVSIRQYALTISRLKSFLGTWTNMQTLDVNRMLTTSSLNLTYHISICTKYAYLALPGTYQAHFVLLLASNLTHHSRYLICINISLLF